MSNPASVRVCAQVDSAETWHWNTGHAIHHCFRQFGDEFSYHAQAICPVCPMNALITWRDQAHSKRIGGMICLWTTCTSDDAVETRSQKFAYVDPHINRSNQAACVTSTCGMRSKRVSGSADFNDKKCRTYSGCKTDTSKIFTPCCSNGRDTPPLHTIASGFTTLAILVKESTPGGATPALFFFVLDHVDRMFM